MWCEGEERDVWCEGEERDECGVRGEGGEGCVVRGEGEGESESVRKGRSVEMRVGYAHICTYT